MIAETPSTRSIFLIDDHPIVREGLAELINREPDLRVCGESDDAASALEAFLVDKPDLVVLDLSLKNCSGIEVIKTLRTRFPEMGVLVLTMHDTSFYAEQALRAGAHGYLTKREASERVLTAIRELLAGEMYVSDQVSPKLLARLLAQGDEPDGDMINRLTARERQVFLLIGHGLGPRQIARELELSPKTVETHRSNIKEKLDLRDARAVLQCAVEWVVNHDDA